MNSYTRWYLLRRKKARLAGVKPSGPFFSSSTASWSDTTPLFGNT